MGLRTRFGSARTMRTAAQNRGQQATAMATCVLQQTWIDFSPSRSAEPRLELRRSGPFGPDTPGAKPPRNTEMLNGYVMPVKSNGWAMRTMAQVWAL